MVLGPLDKVHHDQEVAGKPHLDDDVQLEIQALPIPRHLLRRPVTVEKLQALLQALDGNLAKEDTGAQFLGVFGGILPAAPFGLQGLDGLLFQMLVGFALKKRILLEVLGYGVFGQKIGAEINLNITAPGDLDGIFQRFRDIAEQLRHFLRRAQVLLVAVGAHPPRVVQGTTVVNTDPHLVGLELLGVEKAHVIGRHHRAVQFLGQLDGGVQIFLVVFPPGALQLQIKTVGKQGHHRLQALTRQGVFAVHQRLADFALLTAGQDDHTLGTLRQPLLADIGLAQVLPLQVGP